MTPLYEDLQLALMQERDIRELAILDTIMLDRVRARIKDQGDMHEKEILADLLTDLQVLRIDKMVRMAYKDSVQDQVPDLEGAQEAEIELYLAVRKNLEKCAELLGVNLNGGDAE